MENLIWGMRTVAFSQIENEKGKSHEFIRAVDMQGDGTDQNDWFAPCTCKVVAKSSSAHTVFFVSCDEYGYNAPVHCADGVDRLVTIALTHIDDYSWITIGKVYRQGERCYREGTYANGKKGAVSNHVHLEVANGYVTFKESVKINGESVVRFPSSVALKPTEVFFVKEGYHTVREDKLRGVKLRYLEESEDMKIRMKAVKEVVVLREEISFDKNKKPNGKIIAKMPKGGSAEVRGFYPIQKDGYQWLGVSYNGQIGYMQYDSKCYELEEKG